MTLFKTENPAPTPGKSSKSRLCRKVVKPPEPPNSCQPFDSAAEINFKIWRVYPLGFASLEVEIKQGASFPACAFSFAGESHFNP
jgi:hypothetical protein